MIYAVFLCEPDWTIRQILYKTPQVIAQERERFADLISQPSDLPQEDEALSAAVLTLPASQLTTPVLFRSFAGKWLVFLVHVTNESEFTAFARDYARCIAWAEVWLKPHQDEYYQIQQMNNQLINSQRALTKCNQQLKHVLHQVRTASDTIALLEQDELTCLYNTNAFYNRVRQWLDKHPGTPCDLVVLDIAHFQQVGEIFGRKTSDQLLQDFALFLTGLDRTEAGIFARTASDTFSLFLPGELHFYETLQEKLPGFFAAYPLPIHLFGRMGIYSDPAPAISAEQMFGRARLALDTLRSGGRDEIRVAFYDQTLHQKLLLEHKILDSVQSALTNRDFRLYLQPKIDMTTRQVIGAEALIRWIHPELGFIPPDQFIPLLEREGLVYQVDQYVWQEACRFLHGRRARGEKLIPVSVNLARGDVYQPDLQAVLTTLLTQYDLTPKDLNLEIIERAYTDDTDNMFRVLTQLRERGFLIEMDDFGVGASSLSMAAEMPVDVLKLDRSFLTSDTPDQRHLAVIRFIIDLAKTLHMTVLAEGVETQAQADLLQSLGCRYAQGYLYGRPVLAEEFSTELQRE